MANDKAPKQIEFFVSKSEQQLGPWTIQEVAAQLAAGHIAVTDFVYDDDRAEWIALFESEPLKAHLNAAKPKAAPAPKAAVKVEKTEPASTEAALAKAFTARRDQTIVETATVKAPTNEAAAEWFVQKGPNRYGPFTYLGVVRALQEKTVYEFDLVWKEGMAEWVRIAQHEAITPDCIRGLATDAASSEGVFQKRQHARIPFESEVIVHDNRSVWLGRAFEGSVGGSGLIIENATLVPGHCAPSLCGS